MKEIAQQKNHARQPGDAIGNPRVFEYCQGMFTGPEMTSLLLELGVSHVIWLPSSGSGPWESSLEQCPDLTLVRICREGEAWPLAAGLCMGGKSPVVMIQTTGLYESGDALRNVLYDLRLPIFAIIGARSWLNAESRDSAKRFAEPILKAWELDYVIIADPQEKDLLRSHYQKTQQAGIAGAVLIGEGRM